MDNDKVWASMWFGIAVVIALFIGYCVYNDTVQTTSAFQNGYEQVILPGSTTAKWQKVR